MFELEGKVALITGGGHGIGEAIGIAFAEAGANIGVLDFVEERALKAKEKFESMGVKSCAIVADVTKPETVATVFDKLEAEIGSVNIMVNNVGKGSMSLIFEMDNEEWLSTIDTCLNSTFYYTREAALRMIPKGWGRIINISSVAAKRISIFGTGAYSAAKAGVLGLTRHSAYDLGRFGITVNAICPGDTITEGTSALFVPYQEEREAYIPMGQMTTVRDHACLARYLASDEAGMVTGQAWDVDGGSQIAWMKYNQYLNIRAITSSKKKTEKE